MKQQLVFFNMVHEIQTHEEISVYLCFTFEIITSCNNQTNNYDTYSETNKVQWNKPLNIVQ